MVEGWGAGREGRARMWRGGRRAKMCGGELKEGRKLRRQGSGRRQELGFRSLEREERIESSVSMSSSSSSRTLAPVLVERRGRKQG